MYCPPAPYGMWDTWLFRDGDEYHLFFLQSEPDVTWNTLGRAVSKDLVHWEPLAPIPTKGAPGEWDFDPTLTGMTVKLGDRYATFYGSATGGVQRIGLMFAESLYGPWAKYERNPTLVSKPPHYSGSDWRDMCTFFEPREGLWHGYICAQAGDGTPELPTIGDKTLVAWVTLANPEQRAGSALTIEHGLGMRDSFDGIVFGEKEPGKWMAGSDTFKRTEQDQSAYPVETAGPDELVQMAIAYRGNEVTIYRNGEPVASYTAPGQQLFGSGSSVLMGLRHTAAGVNAPRFFAGTVEEARLYEVALDQASIAKLRLGEPSDPKPIGLWTFEDGTARDEMGTFPEGVLHGGARIAGGRLHLNGTDAYVATPSVPGGHPAVAHLTSRDLIEWDYHPAVLVSPDYVDMEVPDYFELNGKHYLLFSSGRTRKDVGGRTDATGTWYAMADHRDGPYHFPADPLLVASGRGRFDNYVGRTIPFGRGRLLYHHTAGGPVTWAMPKLVRQRHDGTLWLQYWEGFQRAETQVLLDEGNPGRIARVFGQPEVRRAGDRLGLTATKGAIVVFPYDLRDVSWSCRVDQAKGSAGLVWRYDGKQGVGAILSRDQRTLSLVNVAWEDNLINTETIDDMQGITVPPGARYLRAIVRAHRVEVYLDDRWVFGASLPEALPTGLVGLIAKGSFANFPQYRLALLEPMPVIGGQP